MTHWEKKIQNISNLEDKIFKLKVNMETLAGKKEELERKLDIMRLKAVEEYHNEVYNLPSE